MPRYYVKKGKEIMRNLLLARYLILAGLAIFAMLAVAACGSDEKKGPIVLIEQDWDGQLVTTAVAKILLEDELGYEVVQKFAAADSAAMFAGLDSGDFHFACCNWPSFSAGFLDEFVDTKGTVVRMGSSGVLGTSHWYVPRYVIEGDTDRGIEPLAPNLKTYRDMNQYKELFATADTGPKGRFLDYTPAWDYRNQERLDALGVDFEVVYGGSEAAGLAELNAADQRGDPIMLVLWTPHWAGSKYDLVPVEIPPHDADCYVAGQDVSEAEFDCGFAIDPVSKLGWSGFAEEFPKAHQFLSKFQITNDQQNEMVLAVTEGGKDYEVAAQEWIDANENIWKAWIP